MHIARSINTHTLIHTHLTRFLAHAVSNDTTLGSARAQWRSLVRHAGQNKCRPGKILSLRPLTCSSVFRPFTQSKNSAPWEMFTPGQPFLYRQPWLRHCTGYFHTSCLQCNSSQACIMSRQTRRAKSAHKLGSLPNRIFSSFFRFLQTPFHPRLVLSHAAATRWCHSQQFSEAFA